MGIGVGEVLSCWLERRANEVFEEKKEDPRPISSSSNSWAGDRDEVIEAALPAGEGGEV